VGTVQFVQPFSGVALAALVLHERITLPLAAAGVAILVGIAVAQR
jgi:drug/metabolite transporter (DMT)-like permease